jgi:cytochrome c oxidase subunit II
MPLEATRRPCIFMLRRACALLAVVGLAGCMAEHEQSMLHPAGPAAAKVAMLWWVLFAICTGVFLVTLGLLAAALLVRDNPERRPGNRFITVSGIIIPGVILMVILVYSLDATVMLKSSETQGAPIRVIGHKWWWEVHYDDGAIISANEIHVPVGRPIRFELRSNDVVHSFWVPNFGGKMDMLPEHDNHFWLQADRTGRFRGQCAEYCGGPHALMAFPFVVMEEDEFERWLEVNRQDAPEPTTPHLQRGKEIFFQAACQNCHAIKGTAAHGRIGPDLTHMGSRLTLGAGIIPNDREHLAAWIRDPQVFKWGNLMPHSTLSDEDIETLTDYLLSLH